MRFELAKTGTFNGKKITKGMLSDIVSAFSDAVPVIIGHAVAMWTDDAPAVGWVRSVEVEKSSLVGSVEFTAEGQKLWDSKAYRHWSVGLAKDSEDAPWELAHLALLGASNPAIKGLRVLELSEGKRPFRAEFTNEIKEENETMNPDEIREQIRAEFAAKQEADKAEFAAREAAKDAEIAALKADVEKAKRAEFSARVEAVFSTAAGKVPAEKVKDLKAVFAQENVTVGEILESLNAMFSGMPTMVQTGRMTPQVNNADQGEEISLNKKGLI